MPLNPPSYNGQDVWYSPNVYANMSPIALWKAPVNATSLIYSYTLPEPTLAPSSDPSAASAYTQATIANSGNEFKNFNGVPGVVANPGTTASNPNGVIPPNPSTLALPPGQGQYQTLINNLSASYKDALAGKWANQSHSNPLVAAAFKDAGSDLTGTSPWCAAYVSSMLFRSGISGMKSVNAYALGGMGKEVPISDPKQWRTGDVCVWNWGHVNFLLSASGSTCHCQGGNQGGNGGNLTRDDISASKLKNLRRNWEIPTSVVGYITVP